MKQVDLAKALNVTKTTVSRYCGGRVPDAGTLNRLAVHFGVSVDYLLGRTDDPKVKYIGKDPADDLIFFLRGQRLTPEDIEAVKDLLEARRLRREREEHRG
jgi:transcriptional regulator with XRE-family HTH domain